MCVSVSFALVRYIILLLVAILYYSSSAIMEFGAMSKTSKTKYKLRKKVNVPTTIMPTSVSTVSVSNALVLNTVKTTMSRQAEFVTFLPVTRSDGAAADHRSETTAVSNTEAEFMESLCCPETVSNTEAEVMEPLPGSVGAVSVRGPATITAVWRQHHHHNVINKVVVQTSVVEVIHRYWVSSASMPKCPKPKEERCFIGTQSCPGQVR